MIVFFFKTNIKFNFQINLANFDWKTSIHNTPLLQWGVFYIPRFWGLLDF